MNSHAVAEWLSGALVKRKLFRLPAFSRHHVHVEISVVLPRESQPFPIRRKLRK